VEKRGEKKYVGGPVPGGGSERKRKERKIFIRDLI